MEERGMPCMKINLAIMHATGTLSLYTVLSHTGQQTVVRHIQFLICESEYLKEYYFSFILILR